MICIIGKMVLSMRKNFMAGKRTFLVDKTSKEKAAGIVLTVLSANVDAAVAVAAADTMVAAATDNR
ncbi:hypothetical protein [Bacillus sp. 1P06AnD]|uniref:hypothetical protein n=1 Tax=Bacillus sp. 1P06AnD TaxID=3132208 RepID=UPI0039A21A9B